MHPWFEFKDALSLSWGHVGLQNAAGPELLVQYGSSAVVLGKMLPYSAANLT